MRLGLISDIHAQARALRRALRLLEDQGVDKILCAGDVVEKGPRGDAVIATLQSWLIPCVRGNHDENAVRLARRGRRELSRASLGFLEALPLTRSYEWRGRRLVLAHGSPVSNRTYLNDPKTHGELAGVEADILITGHSHSPMDKRIGDLRLINPGSVRDESQRDSGTCAWLDLASGRFEVLRIKSGRPVRLRAGQ